MKVKWAVWGSGGIARRRTIPEGLMNAANAELAAVYDVDRDVNLDVAREYGVKACATEEELLATACDAIYIATPASLHCEQTIRAASLGRHILCEKPFGLTIEEAQRMVDACCKHQVSLGIGMMMRFHAQHQAALAMIREGRLGKPVFARAQLSCWYPPIEGAWRQDPATGGGGSLMDLGGHCIDLLEMFFGPVSQVACSTGRLVQDYPSEDTAVALLEFANGAKGVVDCLFNVPDESSMNRLELYGSRGSILAEGTIGQGEAGTMVARVQAEEQDYEAQQARSEGGGMPLSPAPVNMYRAEIEAFSRAILSGTPPPVGAEAGLSSQRILAACYESAATGRAVAL